MTIKVMLSVGEASGEKLAIALMNALKKKHSSIDFYGMGALAMKQQGMRLVVNSDALAVMGIVEVIKNWRIIRQGFAQMKQALKESPPDALVLVDYVEFNLRLGKYAKSLGIPVLFVVGPQIWAWRPKRVRKFHQSMDSIALLFPFEVEWYQGTGIDARYVGHPLGIALADKTWEPEYHSCAEQKLIGLLPGSRSAELKQHLPIIAQTIALLHKKHPQWRFTLALAQYERDQELLDSWLQSVTDLPLTVEVARTQEIMRRANALLVCSGTATLEAGLIGTPMVVFYKTHTVTYRFIKAMAKVKHISLVNIILNRTVVTELIQQDATPHNIAHATEAITAANGKTRITSDLRELKQEIGQHDTGAKMAEMVADLLAPKA